jgi:hypothetical protein
VVRGGVTVKVKAPDGEVLVSTPGVGVVLRTWAPARAEPLTEAEPDTVTGSPAMAKAGALDVTVGLSFTRGTRTVRASGPTLPLLEVEKARG